MVPELTLSPTPFSTGIGSPVIIDSSILLSPSVISPSTGILSPGFTLSKSPSFISCIDITLSPVFSTMVASEGASLRSSFKAPLV